MVLSTADFRDCRFEGNEADLGGAVYALESEVRMTGADFRDNAALARTSDKYSFTTEYPTHTSTSYTYTRGYGGALYIDASSLTLEHSRITGGSAFYGAGLALETDSSATIRYSVFTGNVTRGYTDESCYDDECTYTEGGLQGGGVWLKGAAQLEASILAYNTGYNLYRVGVIPALRDCDLYSPSGVENHNLGLPMGVIEVEPRFLRYEAGLPADVHLATSSPLVDAFTSSELDPDGSAADIGLYGGPGSDLRDIDHDGVLDWFWPGTIDDAPAGFDPGDYDAGDRDPAFH